ncbi:MAG: hypothetical protein QOI44_1706, partial [Actinomycetota bacterium]|nr:hypothetical protein [Actinomycetota bacterium]
MTFPPARTSIRQRAVVAAAVTLVLVLGLVLGACSSSAKPGATGVCSSAAEPGKPDPTT